MLFNSLQFLLFFPLVTALFFVLPQRFRWFLLLAGSCFFYMAFIPYYIAILAITIAVDYGAGIWIEDSSGPKRRRYLILSIAMTCLVLFVFKYYNFAATNLNALATALHWNYSMDALRLALPIGLSFHTFQSLAYVVEVYRGRQRAERHFGIYSLYVMFYPQLVAGPIERPQNLLHQFRTVHEFSHERVRDGLLLMLFGFFKKLVVADRLALYVDAVYNNVPQHNGPTLATATVFFALQIYADFSGYSDIAIGAAKVMGFELMLNFNRPYFSKSISEFWRRWHISLSTWFQDFVYIPLGGNRVGRSRWYANLLMTFVISGLWHGANWTFLVWGALNGLYLVSSYVLLPVRQATVYRLGALHLSGLHAPLRVLLTFALTCVAWVFFRAANLSDAWMVLQKIASTGGELYTGGAKDFIYCVVGAALLLTLDYLTRGQRFEACVGKQRLARRWAVYLFLLGCILTMGVFDASQFIYFQF